MQNLALPALLTSLVLLAGLGWYVTELRSEVARLKQELRRVTSAPERNARPAASMQTSATPPRVAGPDRKLSAEQRAALVRGLGGPNSSLANPVWFATVPNDPEAAAFQKELQSAFEEAGWIVKGNAPVRFRMKPGVYVFAADEDPPSYVGMAQQALQDAGIEITQSGRGYREFYRQKKAENPNWIGFDLAEDQTYVIVIGRKPEPTPPAS
ncbi:MAG: hypothetical protein N3C12_01330 [Candidatus Binatia bacterium]|nr:hypothetical protein [Candidatus Binatia bacterium]